MRIANASSASTPPSPLLSKRSTNETYLIDTISVTAQKMSDSTPNTLASVSGSLCAPPNASWKAYSGLVPMSPKTTPIAPSVSAPSRLRGAPGWRDASVCKAIASMLRCSGARLYARPANGAATLGHPDRLGERVAHPARPLPHEVLQLLPHPCVTRVVEAVHPLERVVCEIVELAGAAPELEGRLVGLRADGAQLQPHAAARRMHVPLAPRCGARLGLAAEDPLQRLALQRDRRRYAGEVVKGRREVDRRHRLADHPVLRDAGARDDQADAQQVLERPGSLQVEPMVAHHVAVVGGEDHERVFPQSPVLERAEYPADVVIDERDHPVVVGGHLGELPVGLLRHARNLGAQVAELRVGERRRALQRGLVPPGPHRGRVFAVRTGERHVARIVQLAPRHRAVERLVRIGKRDPGAEGT